MLDLNDAHEILLTFLYSLVGAVIFGGVFLAVVKLAPFSVIKEIEEDQNVALAILIGSVLIGLALIVAAAIG